MSDDEKTGEAHEQPQPIPISELEALKAAASARGFEWGESQNLYEGHLKGEFMPSVTGSLPRHDSVISDPSTAGSRRTSWPGTNCRIGPCPAPA